MVETRERLTPEERFARQRHLRRVGELAFGPAWQAHVSRELTDIMKRPAALSSVNSWSNGLKPVPAWAMDGLRRIAEKASYNLQARALLLRELAGSESRSTPQEEFETIARGLAFIDEVVAEEVAQAQAALEAAAK